MYQYNFTMPDWTFSTTFTNEVVSFVFTNGMTFGQGFFFG